VVLLPKEKIVYTVDWVGVGAPPAPQGFTIDTYPDDWVEGLRKLQAMDWDRTIPGHGARLGTKADVARQIEYMTDLKTVAKTLDDAGKCNAEGVAATPIPAKYEGYAPPATWQVAVNRYCAYHRQGY
jgi:glyoxylase-like metal-dependent hydrolase (beta-lactamase superfamily II)